MLISSLTSFAVALAPFASWTPHVRCAAGAVGAVRSGTPILCAPTDGSYVHVHGLPWELEKQDVVTAISPLLPEGAELIDLLLPLDKRARNTGRALLNLGGNVDASAIVDALHMEYVGARWLEVRLSTEAEFKFHQRGIEAIVDKASKRARQAYSRPAQADAVRLPDDPRDIVVVCHSTPPHVSDGRFELNNLPNGRVDVLARCATQALFVSHGVRRSTRVWFHLADACLTVACDGMTAKGLHPDERSMAAALKRSLNEHHRLNGMYGPAAAHAPPGTPGHGMPLGWSVHAETFHDRLLALGVSGLPHPPLAETAGREEPQPPTQPPSRFLVLHEQGASLTQDLLVRPALSVDEAPSPSSLAVATRSVLVVGDHEGFTVEEEEVMAALGGIKASVSPLPLLASQCIVLAHAALDVAALAE